MSLSAFAAASLLFGAQFGQADFPSNEQVQECLPAVSMLMAVAAIEMSKGEGQGEGEEGQFAQLFETSSRANLTLVAWDQYYRGIFWDDPRFEDSSLARSAEVAQQTFAILREEAAMDMPMNVLVATGFDCMMLTTQHTMITNMDGSAGEI